jgi:uncharacterized protein (TIGR00251 family)
MRHLRVHVQPDAKQDAVSKNDDGILEITTPEPAESGRANQAVITIVSDYLSVSGRVRIVSGHKSRQKILAIDT